MRLSVLTETHAAVQTSLHARTTALALFFVNRDSPVRFCPRNSTAGAGLMQAGRSQWWQALHPVQRSSEKAKGEPAGALASSACSGGRSPAMDGLTGGSSSLSTCTLQEFHPACPWRARVGVQVVHRDRPAPGGIQVYTSARASLRAPEVRWSCRQWVNSSLSVLLLKDGGRCFLKHDT